MYIDLERINKAIRRARRKWKTSENTTVEPIQVQPTDSLAGIIGSIAKKEAPINARNPQPSRRITCPLAPVEQCVYGFFTPLCCYCQSLQHILDNINFVLPDSRAVELIREDAKNDAFDELLDTIKDILSIDDDCNQTELIEEILERIDAHICAEGIEALTLNQLEIIRAMLLLKDEPNNSIISTLIREMTQNLYDKIALFHP